MRPSFFIFIAYINIIDLLYFLKINTYEVYLITSDIISDLTGKRIPKLSLTATNGGKVDISTLNGISIIYIYPRTSPPNEPPLKGWDKIPGARGCTLQSRNYATNYKAILSAGADRVYGLSTQKSGYQKEAVKRLSLPFHLLSDNNLSLATTLGLPTFKIGDTTLLIRITLILQNGRIKKVFFPIKSPEKNAALVLQYLSGTELK